MLYSEEYKTRKMQVEYQNLKFQHDIRNSALAKLQTIRNLEYEEARSYKQALAEKITTHAHQQMNQASPEFKRKLLDRAIELIPKSGEDSLTKRGTSPIKDLFTSFFKSKPLAPKELGVKSRVQSYLERNQKHD